MNGFIKRLLGFSIGPVGGAVIAFVTIPLTTHFVSPDEYGKAGMFTVFQTLMVTLLYLGVDQAYTREYNDAKDRQALFKNALLLPLALSVILLFSISLSSGWISYLLFGKNSYHFAAILLGVMLVFMIIERFILLSIRMDERAFEYSLFNILIKLVILLATLLFVLLIRRDFLAVVYSAAIGQIAGDAYLIFRYRRLLVYKNFHLDRTLIRQLLEFGIPLVIAASVASVLNSAGRLALRTWSTFYEIGIFTATVKISAALSVVQTSFTNFWVPTAYRWYSEHKDIFYYKVVSDSVLLFMSTLFFLILIFKNLIVWLLSPGYSDAVYILGFLCLQPVMYTISETTTLGIVFSKKSYLNIWVSLISLLPCLVLNAVLIPRYGAAGAACATGVSYVFFFWGRSHFSNKNWTGFPLGIHFAVILIMFAGALVNAFPLKYILLLNLGMMILVLVSQIGTIRRIKTVAFTRKSTQKFSKN